MLLLQSSLSMMMMTMTKSITICKPQKSSIFLLKNNKNKHLRCCSVSMAPPESTTLTTTKPSPAEVSRTIMELSSSATLSIPYLFQDDCWPVGVGVRFAVDPQGTPIVCLNASSNQHQNSTLNVQLQQCGLLRTTQCTIQGSLHRPPPHNQSLFKSLWEKRFKQVADPHSIHILSVQRVLHIDNFMEDAVWISSSDYTLATPDPLRDFAHHLLHDINTHNMEDVLRFCNVYVHSDIQVSQANMVWVDRLGFDIHIYSPQNDVFEVRIPFPREVTNEKAAKSSFNGMAQLAWEVEKNYHPLQFEKVTHLKKIASKV